ncbi:MAG: ribokinase [Chloroflexi bacterium]|nr:ribokinase [Chloroflexota bacterium]
MLLEPPLVLVLGALNYDLIAVAQRFPEPGESVLGTAFYTSAGGKGGNQAVAAARLGARTRLIGRVGGDGFGKELLASLRAYGVDASGVAVEPGVTSGVAHITVDASGQNKIVIVSGANGLCGEAELGRLRNALPLAGALLLQNELPLPLSLAAARAARAAGVPVVFDPAPAGPLPHEAYALMDYITPNESEAAALVGFPVTDPPSGLRAARELRRRGARAAIVKLGGQGACYASEEGEGHVPAFRVAVVDTVGAGDAFNGALAVARAEGKGLREAVVWANAAGAVAVTKRGAQAAMPSREEVEALVRQQPLAC